MEKPILFTLPLHGRVISWVFLETIFILRYQSLFSCDNKLISVVSFKIKIIYLTHKISCYVSRLFYSLISFLFGEDSAADLILDTL